MERTHILSGIVFAVALLAMSGRAAAQSLQLNDKGFFESGSVDVRVYDSPEGIRIFQKDRLVASGGGVFVGDVQATVVSSNLNIASDKLELRMSAGDFNFYLKARPEGLGMEFSVFLTEPFPAGLEVYPAFKLVFPSELYFGKTCLVDGKPVVLPSEGVFGRSVALAPEDDAARLAVRSDAVVELLAGPDELELRSAVKPGAVGEVLKWYVEPSGDSRWTKDVEICWSRIGYSCGQKKTVALIMDAQDDPESSAIVYRINEDGYRQQVYQLAVRKWGRIDARSSYAAADFSMVKEPGVYCIGYGNNVSGAFVISDEVFDGKWKDALRLLPQKLEAGRYEAEDVLSGLVYLWEGFRPEEDFTGNGVPDVIDCISRCARSIVDGDVFASALPLEAKFRRVAALAAAGRALRGFDDALAGKAANYAKLIWDMNSRSESEGKFDAACQMWFATQNASYGAIVRSTAVKMAVAPGEAGPAVLLYNLMDNGTKKKLDAAVYGYSAALKSASAATPFGTPSLEGRRLLEWALDYYDFWKIFPASAEPSVVPACLSAFYGVHSYADEYLLDSMDAGTIPYFIALSIACERVAAGLAR